MNCLTWTPTADNINALPDPIRSYIHDLETRCDPAGDLRARRVAEDTVLALEAEVASLTTRITELTNRAN